MLDGIDQKSIRDRLIEEEFPQVLDRVKDAVSKYNMISEGETILAAVSGGKDSLTMMHFLDYLSRHNLWRFKLLVCNIDLGYGCAKREVLKRHFEDYNIDYVFVEKDILQGKSRKDIDCFWCSWNRRKALFETAEKYGVSKISLGHHSDDVIHTTMMNLFFYGEISTAPPRMELFDGKIILIRPLVYVKEEHTRLFAEKMSFSLPCCACPNQDSSRRKFTKDVISPMLTKYPQTRENIIRALELVSTEFNSER